MHVLGDFKSAFDFDRGVPGSAETPTVVRACRPLSPKTSTIRSDGAIHDFRAVDEVRPPN